MLDPRAEQVTRLLNALGGGNAAAGEELLPLVYDELRALAAGFLRRERREHTLQPTALVHEAYLKMVARGGEIAHRREFLAVAAVAMRRVLTDHARRKLAEKRGGARQRITLAPDLTPAAGAELDVIDLDEALVRLAELDPRKSRVVELRFFAGLSCEEVAEILSVSRKTVVDDWTVARIWLHRELTGSDAS